MKRTHSPLSRPLALLARDGAMGLVQWARDMSRRRALDAMHPEGEARLWLARRAPVLASKLARRRAALGSRAPQFAIAILGDNENARAATIASLRAGAYERWREARAIPDPREATHEAEWWIAVAAGDQFNSEALLVLAEAVRGDPTAPTDLAYADELVAADSATGFARPRCKPAWSPRLACSIPAVYPGAPCALRAALVQDALAEAPLIQGAEWVDLVLRVAERMSCAVHVPRPLVTRTARSPERDPTAGPQQALAQAVGASLTRRGIAGDVRVESGGGIDVSLTPRDEHALISILVPTRDRPDLLGPLLHALSRLPRLPATELLLLDHATTDAEALRLLERACAEQDARVFRFEGKFNFSRMIDDGARQARGTLLLLLNNDVLPRDDRFLANLHGALAFPGALVAGARLSYPDGALQHAGIGIGIGTVTGHPFKGMHVGANEPFEHAFVSPQVSREVAAVTAAACLVDRAAFERAGGLDATHFPVSFNDVDLCLKLRAGGGGVLLEPRAHLDHHESASRDPILDAREVREFRSRWGANARDPYLSPWWWHGSERPHLDVWRNSAPASYSSRA